MQASEDNKTPGLVRGLGVWAATAIVIGAMIGQSVFLVSSDMSREVGSMTKVLVVWLVGGVVVLFGAFCYAELGAAMPEAGGDYIYLSHGIGPTWGFLFGWTSAMIMKPGSAAIIAGGLLRFVGFLLPSVADPMFTWHVRIPFESQPYQFTFTAAQPLAAGVVVVVSGLNYLGVRTAGRVQVFLTALKVAAVAAILVLGLRAKGLAGAQQPLIVSPAHGALVAFLTALVPVMAAYNGFQSLGSVGGEVLNPRKNLPRAAILGTSMVIALYLLVNWVYFHLLSFSQVSQSQHVASDAVTRLVGDVGAKWFTVAMIVSAFGSLHAGFLMGPRVPYAMARDGNFFSFAKRIQPRFHTPSGAVLFQGCVAILLVLTGTHQELYSYTMFATWAFLGLTAVALVRLRTTNPELVRPYRVWGYPLTPLIFGAAAFAISVNLWLVRPVRSSIGLAIILLGVPFFHHWRKHGKAPLICASSEEPVSASLTQNLEQR
jgi:basic amino acid/polyamine antiporter, APA family